MKHRGTVSIPIDSHTYTLLLATFELVLMLEFLSLLVAALVVVFVPTTTSSLPHDQNDNDVSIASLSSLIATWMVDI